MPGLASTFRTQKIALGKAVYISGGTVPIDISRGLLLKSIHCRFSGTFTVAGAAGTLLSDFPLGLISRVELVADGRKPFISADARALWKFDHIMRGKKPEILGPATGGIVASTPFSAKFSIDMQAMRFAIPIDSYLDTRLYDGLQLKFTFASASAGIIPGGGGTTSVDAGATVDVTGEYTAAGFEFPKFARIMISEDVPVVAVSSNLRQPIPRNGILAQSLYRTDNDSILSDAIINNITIRSDNTVYHRDHLPWASLQSQNLQDYQLDGGGTGGLQTGNALIDYSEDGMLSSCIDTTQINTFDSIFDVSLPAGTTRNIHITHVYYEPLIR